METKVKLSTSIIGIVVVHLQKLHVHIWHQIPSINFTNRMENQQINFQRNTKTIFFIEFRISNAQYPKFTHTDIHTFMCNINAYTILAFGYRYIYSIEQTYKVSKIFLFGFSEKPISVVMFKCLQEKLIIPECKRWPMFVAKPLLEGTSCSY